MYQQPRVSRCNWQEGSPSLLASQVSTGPEASLSPWPPSGDFPALSQGGWKGASTGAQRLHHPGSFSLVFGSALPHLGCDLLLNTACHQCQPSPSSGAGAPGLTGRQEREGGFEQHSHPPHPPSARSALEVCSSTELCQEHVKPLLCKPSSSGLLTIAARPNETLTGGMAGR